MPIPQRNRTQPAASVDIQFWIRRPDHEVFPAVRLGFHAGVLAEEIVFPGSGKGRVGVCAADHAKFVWVNPQFFFQQQASFQRFAGVFPAATYLQF